MPPPKNLNMKVLAHTRCREALWNDLANDMIYGPYAIELEGTQQKCRVCDGLGSHALRSHDPIIPPALRGKPIPCEFCKGTGYRKKLNFVSMEEWARITGLCVYCGEHREE